MFPATARIAVEEFAILLPAGDSPRAITKKLIAARGLKHLMLQGAQFAHFLEVGSRTAGLNVFEIRTQFS
jgi:hypothetical protein